jgi:hypothetical protein
MPGVVAGLSLEHAHSGHAGAVDPCRGTIGSEDACGIDRTITRHDEATSAPRTEREDADGDLRQGGRSAHAKGNRHDPSGEPTARDGRWLCAARLTMHGTDHVSSTSKPVHGRRRTPRPGSCNRDSIVIVPHRRSHGFRGGARNLVVRPPSPGHDRRYNEPPTIEIG